MINDPATFDIVPLGADVLSVLWALPTCGSEARRALDRLLLDRRQVTQDVLVGSGVGLGMSVGSDLPGHCTFGASMIS